MTSSESQSSSPEAVDSASDQDHLHIELLSSRSQSGGFSSADEKTQGGKDKEQVLDPAATRKLAATIQSVFSEFAETLKDSQKLHPTEVELSVSLGMEASKNWVIVAGKASGTISVKLKWVLK